jgi:hypothetical protein
MANIPSYYPTPALQFLADRFENDNKKSKTYEWNIGGWAATKLKKVFSCEATTSGLLSLKEPTS